MSYSWGWYCLCPSWLFSNVEATGSENMLPKHVDDPSYLDPLLLMHYLIILCLLISQPSIYWAEAIDLLCLRKRTPLKWLVCDPCGGMMCPNSCCMLLYHCYCDKQWRYPCPGRTNSRWRDDWKVTLSHSPMPGSGRKSDYGSIVYVLFGGKAGNRWWPSPYIQLTISCWRVSITNVCQMESDNLTRLTPVHCGIEAGKLVSLTEAVALWKWHSLSF